MSQEIKKPNIGDVIAGYTILSKLGSGGMGDVYLCDDKSLSRKVAVKIMHAFDPSVDAEAKTRFLLEGKALAKLAHPNIVSVFGLGEDKGYLYIAMEYVPGKSLHYLSRERRLTPREMIFIFADIASGLDHAHSHGLIHRDIKPANILVDAFGRGKIIDFGIAKSIGGNGGTDGVHTKTGAVIGTLNYIAPELFRGDPPSPASDIYALGLLLYEMLTGRTPFKGESQFETMERIRAGKLEIPENLQMLLPEETWEILNEMIDKEPLNRPVTCSAAADRLKAIQFPNLPAYFNTELLQVRIDNVNELRTRLAELEVDPAEWPFILSLAVRKHSERPRQTQITPDEGESTKLIESTGVVVPLELLDEAVDGYKQDLEILLTTRKSEALSQLTPPPITAEPRVQQFTPNAAGVDVAPVLREQARVQPRSRTFEFAIASLLAVGIGLFAWQKMKSADNIAVSQPVNNKKRAGQVVEAPKAAQVLAGGAAVKSSSGGAFAMVVEPPADAWPPVEFRKPGLGEVMTWKWKRRVTDGVTDLKVSEYFERLKFEAEEEGLLKFFVEEATREAGGAQRTKGYEWMLMGFPLIPTKALSSQDYGTFTSQIVGQPSRVFPLRKGKEVQFALNLDHKIEAGRKSELPLESSYRGTCFVRDRIDLTTSLGAANVVKIDCSFKSDKTEITETLYWDHSRGFALRRDRRFSATIDGRPTEIISVGELINVQSGVPSAPVVQSNSVTDRQPSTHKKD